MTRKLLGGFVAVAGLAAAAVLGPRLLPLQGAATGQMIAITQVERDRQRDAALQATFRARLEAEERQLAAATEAEQTRLKIEAEQQARAHASRLKEEERILTDILAWADRYRQQQQASTKTAGTQDKALTVADVRPELPQDNLRRDDQVAGKRDATISIATARIEKRQDHFKRDDQIARKQDEVLALADTYTETDEQRRRRDKKVARLENEALAFGDLPPERESDRLQRLAAEALARRYREDEGRMIAEARARTEGVALGQQALVPSHNPTGTVGRACTDCGPATNGRRTGVRRGGNAANGAAVRARPMRTASAGCAIVRWLQAGF
jgi:hypothetical protein